MVVALLLLFVAVSLGAAGQLCMKYGVGDSAISDLPGLIKSFAKPCVLIGYVLYFVSSLLWLSVLSRLPLSFAYPLVSISYVLVVVSSMLILKEPVSALRWVGVLLICSGVVLIGRTGQ